MENKPVSFNIMAFLFLAVAYSIIGKIIYIYDYPLYKFDLAFVHLTQIEKIIITFCVINSYLCYIASPMLKLSLPATIAAMALNNYYVSQVSNQSSLITTFALTFGVLAIISILLTPQVKLAIASENSKWWKVPKRYAMNLPVSVYVNGENPVHANIYDISKGGAFIKSKQLTKNKLPFTLPVGTDIKIRINRNKPLELRCMAQIVRRSDSNGNYPAGIGIQFKEMDFKTKFLLGFLLGKRDIDV